MVGSDGREYADASQAFELDANGGGGGVGGSGRPVGMEGAAGVGGAGAQAEETEATAMLHAMGTYLSSCLGEALLKEALLCAASSPHAEMPALVPPTLVPAVHALAQWQAQVGASEPGRAVPYAEPLGA